MVGSHGPSRPIDWSLDIKPDDQMRADIADIPLDKLSFRAYRLSLDPADRAQPAAFLSLGHWYEAEKFRAFARDLFLESMHMPSIKEARQHAKRNQTHVRGDWLAVQSRALACGMVYASLADKHASRWNGTPAQIAAHMACLDFPARLTIAACTEFVKLRDAPRVAFLGGNAAPHEIVGKRLHGMHRKAGGHWQLAHWQGRHCSWQIHDWAVQQYVPVTYLGTETARMNAQGQQLIQNAADRVVIFEARNGKKMDAILRGLKALKLSVELDLYSADNLAGLMD